MKNEILLKEVQRLPACADLQVLENAICLIPSDVAIGLAAEISEMIRGNDLVVELIRKVSQKAEMCGRMEVVLDPSDSSMNATLKETLGTRHFFEALLLSALSDTCDKSERMRTLRIKLASALTYYREARRVRRGLGIIPFVKRMELEGRLSSIIAK